MLGKLLSLDLTQSPVKVLGIDLGTTHSVASTLGPSYPRGLTAEACRILALEQPTREGLVTQSASPPSSP